MALLDFSTSPRGGSQRHLPEWQSQPKITPTTIIDHSIVGTGEQGFQHFMDSSNLESHFIVCGAGDRSDGWIYQLMDTDRQADANLQANGYAISIETGDQGNPDAQPWTRAQLESLTWLHAELRRVHPTIPTRESRSCADPAGLGYHTMHGAPSCWTPVSKTCPGVVRKRQWRDVLLPAYLAGTPLQGDLTMADAQDILDKLDGVYRLLSVGDPTHIYSVKAVRDQLGRHQAETADDLGQLKAAVADLQARVDALVLGKVEGDFDVSGVLHATSATPPPA